MLRRYGAIAVALLGLGTGSLMAQTVAPAPANRPAATTPAPSTPAPAASSAQAPRPAASSTARKTNLNTAPAQDLDALPEVGAARTKAIMNERAKGPFKNWEDFDKRMAGTAVNAGVKAKIKDLVSF